MTPQPSSIARPGCALLGTAVDGLNRHARVRQQLHRALHRVLHQPKATAQQHHHDYTTTRLSVWSPTAARRTLAGGLLGLALLAGDVFSPASLHLLQPLDAACHSWVIANVPAEARATWAAKGMSNAAILAGLAGWAYTVTHSSLLQHQQGQGEHNSASSSSEGGSSSSVSSRVSGAGSGSGRGVAAPWQALALAAATYGLGGAFRHAESFLVALIKSGFGRDRPSLVGFTTSFPSGHTTAAMVVSGLLLFLLLPVLQAELRRQDPTAAGSPSPLESSNALAPLWTLNPSAAAVDEAGGAVGVRGGGGPKADGAAPATWLDPLLRHRAAVWVGCGALTASGRVLADAHWVSDTLAGACLGAALVSAAVLSWEALGGSGSHELED